MRFLFAGLSVCCTFLLVGAAAFGQSASFGENPVAATSAEERLEGYTQRGRLLDASLVKNVELRNIGPTVMSGRVVDFDVYEADPSHFYVAYASGGLWKTTNNGISFTPLFDDQASMTIGDIAVDWSNNETIWVGTGENNSSRSSYAGTGVYKSTDGGETWQHMGLAETQRTGRIILHPTDPNTVWVAAAGALYSPNPERGVYKTTDGGRTWTQTLFVDDKTGAIDLVIDPSNPDVLYAAMWHRERRAWNFVESGAGSGIYKSTDGGENWTLISTARSGFPTGVGVGRIGLALHPGDTDILYAFLDNQDRRPDEEPEEDELTLTRDMLRTMSKDAFLALADEEIEAFLEDENFPDRYDMETVKGMVENDEIVPLALVEYLEDANQQLFNTPVIGAEVYRSDNGGRSWRKTHDDYIDNLYFSYGYYFGEIRVAPDDADRIYILGVPLLKSMDGGQTFESISAPNVHADHQAMWVNPSRVGHLIDGNDGGINISYDDGETWFKANSPSVGQFYAIQVDKARSYRVYGGLQDNGVWVGPHTYSASSRWHSTGNYPYDGLLGGDGMQIEVDTRTNETVYTGFQFGFYQRIDRETGQRTSVRPRHELGERPLRFNWQTPIHLSRHNQDILYMGANRLYRSLSKGENLEPISGDLTNGGQAGDVPFGTLTTIDESLLKFGLIYVGSDDGLIHVTPDGGNTWNRISDSLPQDMWVSRVDASSHEESRVYATLNGYRWDHFDAYVYASDDYGATWTRIATDLPLEPVNVIVEDPENEDVLYIGTDHGLYVSLDRGQTTMAMHGGMPNAPVHDLKIQVEAKDLVVGTHGRSIFVAGIEHIQALNEALIAEALHLFDLDRVTYSSRWGARSAAWADAFEPETTLPFYSGTSGEVEVSIQTKDGAILKQWDAEVDRGLNYITYDLTVEARAARRYNDNLPEDDEDAVQMEEADNEQFYLVPGTYTVVIERSGTTVEGSLEVRERR